MYINTYIYIHINIYKYACIYIYMYIVSVSFCNAHPPPRAPGVLQRVINSCVPTHYSFSC